MGYHIKRTAIFVLLLFAVAISNIATASARGAAPSVMNSPGYQRALEESRKRYKDSSSQPSTQRPAVHPRKAWRHRGRR